MKHANHFETHVTLAAGDSGLLESVRAWAEARGLKWTQIALDAGRTPLQPMITFWGSGTMESQREQAESLILDIAAQGLSVVRVKVEAALANEDVPQTDAEARSCGDRYFEHHVKTVLESSRELDSLAACASRHEARLSRNSRRQRDDGRIERFVTQRVYGRGAQAARKSLERLLSGLRSASFEVVEVEAEYVVFDSDVDVDAGWL